MRKQLDFDAEEQRTTLAEWLERQRIEFALMRRECMPNWTHC